MIILDLPQGSIEWITARLWRLTASDMTSNITTEGALSKSQAAIRKIYAMIAGIKAAQDLHAKAAEVDELDEWKLKRWLSHYTGEKFAGNIHTDRGNELEPDALAELSRIIGKKITDVGMCVMGDDKNGVVSCSPDGLIIDCDDVEGVEVKSPCLNTYYSMIMSGKMPSNYKLQVHASMAICNANVWHFGAYAEGMPLHYIRVERDEFTDKVQASLEAFTPMYQEHYTEIMKRIEIMKGIKTINKPAA